MGEDDLLNDVESKPKAVARALSITFGTVARTGDLFMATRFKNAGNTNEIARLSHVLGNLNGTRAAITDDGNFGVNYDLRYSLDNTSNQPRQVEIRLTAPATDGKAHHPLGGEMTTALRLNGRVVEARVDKRGEGTVIGNIVVLPGRPTQVSIEMTNFGNNFPPGAIEFVAR